MEARSVVKTSETKDYLLLPTLLIYVGEEWTAINGATWGHE